MKLEKYYISFGFRHVHSINGRTFDRNCLCQISAKDEESARSIAFDCFGMKWEKSYSSIDNKLLLWFPRGPIPLCGDYIGGS